MTIAEKAVYRMHSINTVTIRSLKMKHLEVVVISKQDISRNLPKTKHIKTEQKLQFEANKRKLSYTKHSTHQMTKSFKICENSRVNRLSSASSKKQEEADLNVCLYIHKRCFKDNCKMANSETKNFLTET